MKLTLIKKVTEAKDTVSFYWQPEQKIKYLPGQYFYFTIPDLHYDDPRGNSRQFTLSSSPTEQMIINTTRVRSKSGFKKTLNELEIGEAIIGNGPHGTFILDEKVLAANHVLIAGGIGITPFRSIVKYAIDKKTNNNFYIIYSNSTPEEITFNKELLSWDRKYPNIKVALTVTQFEQAHNSWTGLRGKIDENLIKKLAIDYSLPTTIFWLCGPPQMVGAMEKMLEKLKVSSDKVNSEKFTGY